MILYFQGPRQDLEPIGVDRFPGHCPYLHRTADGTIILAFRFFTAKTTSLRYSYDECKTWSDNVVVDDKMWGGYPSMVNLKDGSVLIVYYEEGHKSSIRAKRFRITRSGLDWLAP